MQQQKIPTTGRKPHFLAKQAGFKSVADFANSLPKKALVIDVGAGLSRLGAEVVELRPDVRWVNLDPYYGKSGKKTENPMFVAGDITKFSKEVAALESKADVVFSYWMVPHLSAVNDTLATVAVKGMRNLLKSDGHLIIGPVRSLGFGLLSPFRYRSTRRYQKAALDNYVIGRIVTATKLWWLPRRVQFYSNKYNVHLGKYLVGGTKSRPLE